MDTSGIIPDMIDSKPKATVEVTFTGGLKVNMGNELQPKQVKDQPQLKWNAEQGSLYTLLMTDLDPPSRKEPTLREVLHWLVVNIPGNRISEGQVLAEYMSSGPEEGTDLHRYVFLIFKQVEKITTDIFIPKGSFEGRFNVKTRDIIAKYNLGNPIAGNYYLCQYDDYVPILQTTYKK
ncbi:Phosphatidylethanolamine-binding protein like protein F40A3.3 [Lucilia cuprina]|nr:Phosphatidylethanolamine-binding protein like protein F40A3.3 [Lucilia cuprina]